MMADVRPPTSRHSTLFGLVAPELGWAPPVRYLLRRQRILRLLRRCPPGALLEVGCGSGALLHDLSQMGHQSIGLETSEPARSMATAIAQSIGGSQTFQAAPLPEWKGHFDIVCAFDVLEHIADHESAIEQWLSWLRPNGLFCISVPAHAHRWGAGDEWAGHYRRYERDQIKSLLKDAGLVIEHFECYGFPLANLTEALGNHTYRRLLADRRRDVTKEEASSFSGVDRGEAMRVFRKLDTLVGRTCLRLAMNFQALASRTNLGSGYLLLARRS